MRRWRVLAALTSLFLGAAAVLAQEPLPPPNETAPQPAQSPDPLPAAGADAASLPAQPADLGLSANEAARWTDNEKFAWDCVRKGLEANLFVRTCVHPRGEVAEKLRKQRRFEPFIDPAKYKEPNALSDDFLIALLTEPTYVQQIKPIGIRIVGAYFKDAVNLENVTTNVNLVLDQTMARKGLRMTNFESAKNVSFDGSNIRGTVRLMRSRIAGSLFMERAALDIVDLNDADIGASFEATGTIFKGELRFLRAKIDGKVILTQARLTTLLAWNARIGSSLEMRLADIRVGMDLSGSSVEGDVRLQDVTFGRLRAPNSCDWNPRLQFKGGKETRLADLLSTLKATLPPSDFEKAWQEVVMPAEDEKAENGACAPADTNLQPGINQNVLLRDMQIKGSLCLMNITGEIEQPAPAPLTYIKTIAINGTEAKSAIIGWKPSQSRTRWAADNFSTEHLLINLNTQPLVHYVDNLKLRSISFMHGISAAVAGSATAPAGEHVVKDGCELSTDHGTIEPPSSTDVQERIINFFRADESGSAQPLGAIVASLRSSGVNTSRLNKELSVMQNRNACRSSEFAKSFAELGWMTIDKAWLNTLERRKENQSAAGFAAEQMPLMVSDAGCAFWHGIQWNMVRYGHEPLWLAIWIAFAVVTFAVFLKLDRKDPAPYLHRRPFGLVYALDNLIPFKAYRFNAEHADELPNAPFLRGYRVFHRLIGLFFVVMAFLYIYKAT